MFDFDPAYKNYLKSPIWKLKCEKYWQTYGKKCQACGARKKLQVHHKTYDRLGGRELMSDLCGLCNDCHRAVHAIHRRNRRLSLYAVTNRYVLEKRLKSASK